MQCFPLKPVKKRRYSGGQATVWQQAARFSWKLYNNNDSNITVNRITKSSGGNMKVINC